MPLIDKRTVHSAIHTLARECYNAASQVNPQVCLCRGAISMFRTPISFLSTTIKDHMRNAIQTCLALVCACTLLGCFEDPASTNSTDLNQLMSELNAAVLSENESKLEAVITKASKLQTVNGSKAKNMILSTARAKLGKIQNQQVITETTKVLIRFQQAVRVANQAAMLRGVAHSMSSAAEQRGDDAVASFQASMGQVKKSLNSQLDHARAEISRLSLESKKAEAIADALFQEANELLLEADALDAVVGLRPFKQGMTTMRKSDRAYLSANSSRIESEIIATREVDDASAELEAIASQLLGIRHSMELLGSFRQASREGAGALRQLADSRDSDSATLLSEATENASVLLSRWQSASELLNKSLSARGGKSTGTKQSKAASASWKLQTAWALGQMLESQAQFMSSECKALTDVIQAGIVTGTSKWKTLLDACQSQRNSLTTSAVQSYEKAKDAARELGRDGEGASFQLDIRIAKLQGAEAPVSTTVQPPTTNTEIGSTPKENSSNGFSTPQELVAYMQTIGNSSTTIDLSKIYLTKSSEHKTMLAKLQSLSNNRIGLKNTINDTFGRGSTNAIAMLSDGIIPSAIDESGIVMLGDSDASLTLKGITVLLAKSNGGWLIDFASQLQAEGFDQQMLSNIDSLNVALKKVSLQIQNGEISDIGQVEFAIMTAIMGG